MSDQEEFSQDEAVTETAVEQQDWQREGEETDPVTTPPSPIPPYQQERGGVAWCELYGKAKDDAGGMHLVKINLTQRGENAEASLRGLLEALAVAKNEFHMLPYMPALPANPPAVTRQNAPAQNPVPQGNNPPPPPPPAAPGPAQGQVSQAQGGTFQIVKVEVAPRADGKTEVKLYGQGHKFPDLKMIGDPAKIAAQFGNGWQKEHFQVVTAYNVALKVDWQPSSNLNTNGQPYKNVTAINPG